MDCVNHSGVNATAYCQNCGKAICVQCVRNTPGGQIFCEPCVLAWQGAHPGFGAPRCHGPNPSVAAVLGLIFPGVGAMYNGQYIKGLLHVVVFGVLISLAHHFPIFGLFIAAWIFYQSFEAYHTAKAMRDGQPLPDPLGLNEIGSWINPGGAGRGRNAEQDEMEQGSANPGTMGAAGGGYPSSSPAGQYQAPYQWTPQPPPAPDFADQTRQTYQANQAIPPGPPPVCWHRKEPIGAIVLIALGVLFLLEKLDIFSGRLLEFTWPVALIALGVWLIIRRLGDSFGGHK